MENIIYHISFGCKVLFIVHNTFHNLEPFVLSSYHRVEVRHLKKFILEYIIYHISIGCQVLFISIICSYVGVSCSTFLPKGGGVAAPRQDGSA